MSNSLTIPPVTIIASINGVIDVTPPPPVQPVLTAAPVNIADTSGNPIISTNGALNVNVLIQPTKFITASVTASGLSAVWTPAAGKKFRLLALDLEIPSDGAQAVGGDLTIKLKDGATDIGLSWVVFVPAVAVTTGIGLGWNTGWISLGNIGILSAVANNVLNINLAAAMTTSQVRITVAGTEE